MTRDEFTRRWRHHVAGVIALGTERIRKVLSGRLDKAADYGEALLGLEATTDTLLGQLWDSMQPVKPPTDLGPLPARMKPLATVPVNGRAPQTKAAAERK